MGATPARFVLRKAHMDALEKAAEPGFVRQVMAHLRQQHEPRVAGLDDAELSRRVEIGLARGRRHGLKEQTPLRDFVVLMFETNPEFDQHPVVRPILGDSQVPPEKRLERVKKDVTAEQWIEIRKSANPDFWKV